MRCGSVCEFSNSSDVSHFEADNSKPVPVNDPCNCMDVYYSTHGDRKPDKQHRSLKAPSDIICK